MPQVVLPNIRDTDDPNLQIQYMYDAFYKLRKELTFLLQNLDSDNVLEAQSVVADWVYAGKVTTDQIEAGQAKISTALIEDLVVGDNVIMGPNATISWSQVTGKPDIPSTSDIENIATTITANYIATPNLITNIARVAQYLEIGDILDNSEKNLIFHGGDTRRDSRIISSIDGEFSELAFESAAMYFYTRDRILFASPTTYFEGQVEFDGYVGFYGSVDFSGASVSGLNFVRSLSSQTITLQVYDNHLEFRLGNGQYIKLANYSDLS